MNAPLSKAPIFLHSLFRSGSTYLFEVFRRSAENYWCYQEPLNELLMNVDTRPEALLEVSEEMSSLLRHPKLDKPYFWEFHEIRNEIAGLFRKRFCYDDFFPADDYDFTELRAYLGALLRNARGQPVFQCCRSFGRAKFVKREVENAINIFLWRNPRDQWWSYKVASFFDTTSLFILNANNPPKVIDGLKSELMFEEFHDADIAREHAHFDRHRLPPEQSYLLFYTLWCYGFLETRGLADLVINIDSLSNSGVYREQVCAQLESLDIKGIDFSDCRVSQSHYSNQEVDFFGQIEGRVHESFISHGYGKTYIDEIEDLRREHAPASTRSEKHSAKQEALIAEAGRAREASLRLERELASRLAESPQDEGDRQQLHAALQSRDADCRDLEAQYQAMDAERKNIEAAMNVSEAERQRLVAVIHGKDTEIDERENRNVLLRKQIQHLQREVEILEGRSSQLRAALQSRDADCRDLEAAYQAMDAERKNIEAAMSVSEAERQRLVAVIHGKDAEIDERENRNVLLRKQVQHLQREAEILEGRSSQWQTSADTLSKALEEVYASHSWRITEPLRAMRRVPGAVVDAMFAPSAVNRKSTGMRVKGLLMATKAVVNKAPVLKSSIAAWLDHFPGLRLRLQLALTPGSEAPTIETSSQRQVEAVGTMPTRITDDEMNESSPLLMGHVDSPSSPFILSGPVQFSGWICHRDYKVTRVVIKYGLATKECRYGIERQDVQAVHGSFVNSRMSGFDVTLMVSPGKGPLSMDVILENGSSCRFFLDQVYVAAPTLQLPKAGNEVTGTQIVQTTVEALMERIQEGSRYLEAVDSRRRPTM